jgi:hypothetical protein
MALLPGITNIMEQLQNEIIKHKPELKNTIQCIGDNNNDYDETKNITICVYNSVSVIEQYTSQFHKIFIDEAHNIKESSLYNQYDDGYDDEKKVDNSDIDDYEEDYEDDEIEEYEDDVEDELKQSKYMKIITDLTKYNNNVYLSGRNIEGTSVVHIKDMNTYEVLHADTLILSENSVKAMNIAE